ncbi:MAG: response regulator [Nevskia sp.]|nr:response regulator [Nevskia sp.]
MQGTVLLVEDNEDDEALTLRAFKECGIRNPVVVAHDGVEALDYLFGTGAHAGRDPAVLPQLVLLDLKLPRIDGLEVLRRIRSQAATRSLPVVILTSSIERQDVAAAYALGANSFVCKPVEFGEFTENVKQLARYWLEVNEPPP